MEKRSQSTTGPTKRQSSRGARRPQGGASNGARRAAPPAVVRPADTGDGGLVLVDPEGVAIHTAPASVTDSLRYLLARVRLRNNEPLPQLLGVISSVKGEGVTFVARSLALVLANDYDKAVCLVDANWSQPSQVQGVGLAGVLTHQAQLADAIVHTGHARLDMLPAGEASPSQRPVFAQSATLAATFATLRQSYDNVIVDLPAAGASSEGLIIADLLDAVAIVVRQGATAEGQVRDTVNQLGATSVLGVILNAVNTRTPKMLLRRILSW